MKIWVSFSGDFTAMLRIIGTFKSAEDASAAANAFNAMLAVKDKTVKTTEKGPEFSDELVQVFTKHALPRFFNEEDLAQLKAYSAVQPKGNKIVVEQRGFENKAVQKVLVGKGARIEIRSLTPRLKMIATFKSAEDASAAANAFNAMLAVKNKTVKTTEKGPEFSDELIQVFTKHALPRFFNEYELGQFKAYSAIQSEGKKILVEPKGLDIQALAKVLIVKGARIELYMELE